MARAIWKAQIMLGRTEVPVKLYSAVSDRAVHFRLLHEKDLQPVRQHMVDPGSGDVVESADVHRAFETDDGRLVMLEEEELAELEPEASREIRVMRFVPEDAIPHLWYDRPYFLGPDGEAGAYAAFAAAMEAESVAGVARWVMRKKEYVGAVRASGEHLMLITLRHAGEVVPASALPRPGGRDLDAKEVRMARQLVSALEDELDITAWRDEYRERVQELVDAKAAGKVIRFPKAPRRSRKEASLANMLERSLKAAGSERKRA